MKRPIVSALLLLCLLHLQFSASLGGREAFAMALFGERNDRRELEKKATVEGRLPPGQCRT